MTCSSCGDKPKDTAKDFTKAVIEINNPEKLVLFRKVVIPASMGDESQVPASVGKYSNVILFYEANEHTYLYSSDGIPTLLTVKDGGGSGTSDFNELLNRPKYANVEMTSATNIPDVSALDTRLTTVEGVASTALQPTAIDKVVMTDLDVDSNPSTTTIQLNASKENLRTGVASSKNIPLTVASSTSAGIMNSATFDAVTNNTTRINALLDGAVAITGLSANPSQQDLTTAWTTQTGLSTLINRASIYDVTNSKVWTYYSNDTTWYASSNTPQITINTFTNSSEGVIRGSTNTGQVFAENDGTGSVNGWDTLSSSVSTNASNITSLQTAVSGKQDILTAGSNISISPQNVISATVPTVNDATLTIQQNGTDVATFSANSTTNATANITSPVITMTTTDPGEGSVLAANNYIGVYGGDPLNLDYSLAELSTGATWVDGSPIYKKTINFGALPNATSKTVAHGISNLGRVLKIEGYAYRSSNQTTYPIPFISKDAAANNIGTTVNSTNIEIGTGTDRSGITECYVTLYYTKTA